MKDNGPLGAEFVTATVDAIIRRGVLLGRKRAPPYHHPNAAKARAVRMLVYRKGILSSRTILNIAVAKDAALPLQATPYHRGLNTCRGQLTTCLRV